MSCVCRDCERSIPAKHSQPSTGLCGGQQDITCASEPPSAAFSVTADGPISCDLREAADGSVTLRIQSAGTLRISAKDGALKLSIPASSNRRCSPIDCVTTEQPRRQDSFKSKSVTDADVSQSRRPVTSDHQAEVPALIAALRAAISPTQDELSTARSVTSLREKRLPHEAPTTHAAVAKTVASFDRVPKAWEDPFYTETSSGAADYPSNEGATGYGAELIDSCYEDCQSRSEENADFVRESSPASERQENSPLGDNISHRGAGNRKAVKSPSASQTSVVASSVAFAAVDPPAGTQIDVVRNLKAQNIQMEDLRAQKTQMEDAEAQAKEMEVAEAQRKQLKAWWTPATDQYSAVEALLHAARNGRMRVSECLLHDGTYFPFYQREHYPPAEAAEAALTIVSVRDAIVWMAVLARNRKDEEWKVCRTIYTRLLETSDSPGINEERGLIGALYVERWWMHRSKARNAATCVYICNDHRSLTQWPLLAHGHTKWIKPRKEQGNLSAVLNVMRQSNKYLPICRKPQIRLPILETHYEAFHSAL